MAQEPKTSALYKKETRRVSTQNFRRPEKRPGSGEIRKPKQFKGIAVCSGVAIGRVRILFRRTAAMSDRTLEKNEVETELMRLHEAVRASKEQLMVARRKVAQEIGEVEASIFDTHIGMLDDQNLIARIEDSVRRELKPVEVVVSIIVEGFYNALSSSEAQTIRERAADIRDVGIRLLDNLHRFRTGSRAEASVEQGALQGDILFARDLLPSDISTIQRSQVTGVFTECGNGRGHSAILLRALNMPCVMGVHGIAETLNDGDRIIVDGGQGIVHINPSPAKIEEYTKTRAEYEDWRGSLAIDAELPVATRDGHLIKVLCNASSPQDIQIALKEQRADGVGLLRTEVGLMLAETYPSEDDQYKVFKEMLQILGGRQLTIRIMDLGADKTVPYIHLPQTDTGALGLRSFRLAGHLEEHMLIQIRAILRAAVHGDVRLLLPFITNVEDIRQAKRLVRIAERQLDEAGRKYNAKTPLGMMVEIPAAAMSLESFAKEVDFFSVGTNDLTQYLCAADRNHPDVAPWYRGFHPGVLQFLDDLLQRAKRSGKPLTVCGEMAGDPLYTMFLIGIGVQELSMSSPHIPLIKKIIRSTDRTEARLLVERVSRLSSGAQVRELLKSSVETLVSHDLGYWLGSN